VISDISPEGVTFERKPEIRAIVKDNNLLQIVNCKLQNANLNEIQLIGGYDTSNGLMCYRPVNELSYGDYKVTLSVWDAKGNRNTKEWQFSVYEKINDTIPPQASINWPPNGGWAHGAVKITGTVFDENINYYTLSYCEAANSSVWTEIVTVKGTNVINGVLGVLETGGLKDGVYIVRLVAVDKGYNFSSVSPK
jgi:hypothetical protein